MPMTNWIVLFMWKRWTFDGTSKYLCLPDHGFRASLTLGDGKMSFGRAIKATCGEVNIVCCCAQPPTPFEALRVKQTADGAQWRGRIVGKPRMHPDAMS